MPRADHKGYFTFQGSLTTPPCSEEVRWFVLTTPVKITESELAAFGKLYPMNARPTSRSTGARSTRRASSHQLTIAA